MEESCNRSNSARGKPSNRTVRVYFLANSNSHRVFGTKKSKFFSEMYPTNWDELAADVVLHWVSDSSVIRRRR